MEIREWVRTFIKEKLKDSFTEEYPASIIDEVDDSSICEAMVQFFRVLDMTKALKEEEYLIPIGEVFCRLPKQVFLEFLGYNLLFLLPSFAGASAMKMDDSLTVVVIPLKSFERSRVVLVGEIVHELAHIYAGHVDLEQDELADEHEIEADEVAVTWGFEAEIRAMNEEIRLIRERVKSLGRGEIDGRELVY